MNFLTGTQSPKEVFSDKDLTTAKPEDILYRMLSLNSCIFVDPSLPRLDSANKDVSEQSLEIGRGQCGTIFALAGTDKIAKVPNSAEKVQQLLSDFKIHSRVLHAMRGVGGSARMDINVPDLHSWISPKTSAFWSHHGLALPGSAGATSFALVSGRISPVQLPVREALVDVLCPAALRKQKREFLAKAENQNCLIRVYLGRRESTRAKTNIQNIRLQNFPLHVNEMEGLGLETSWFAAVMAETLAVLHWKAYVDGNDVEFILGGSPWCTGMPSSREMEHDDEYTLATLFRHDFARRSLSLWLIDFNQCSVFGDDEAGLKKIVDAFFWNDPY